MANASQYDRTRVASVQLGPRERRRVVANFAALLARGEAIESADWELDAMCVASIGKAELSGDGRSSSVELQACWPGCVSLRCQVTTSVGNVYPQEFVVQVQRAPAYGDLESATGPQKITVTA